MLKSLYRREMNIEDPSKERASIRKMAEDLVEVVNSTTNDYDATDLVERELWDHYSGLPNPNWYDKDNWDEDHALDEVMNSMVDDIEE